MKTERVHIIQFFDILQDRTYAALRRRGVFAWVFPRRNLACSTQSVGFYVKIA